MFGGVNTFEHEPEGKEDRMMKILFMKKKRKYYSEKNPVTSSQCYGHFTAVFIIMKTMAVT